METLKLLMKKPTKLKKSNINILVHDYQLFSMKYFESINDMFTMFIEIVNGLQALRKIYIKVEKVIKILRSLPNK